jgi:hypothetical protein
MPEPRDYDARLRAALDKHPISTTVPGAVFSALLSEAGRRDASLSQVVRELLVRAVQMFEPPA